MNTLQSLVRALDAAVGSDGTADLRRIVEIALAENPAVTVGDLVDIVAEARADALADSQHRLELVLVDDSQYRLELVRV